jgi:hypothetical protein
MPENEIKKGANAVKRHWVAFLVAGAVLVVVALWYDHKNNGALTQKVASLPLVGKLFA